MDLGVFWFPTATGLAAIVAVVGYSFEQQVEDMVAKAIWRTIALASTVALGVAWGLTITGPRMVG